MSRFILTFAIMTLSLSSLYSCGSKSTEAEAATAEPAPWIVDKFDDIKVLRYEVPGFEKLPLQQKTLIYYLAQATKAGRDILFDQNFKYNLTIRRTLESIYTKYNGDRSDANFVAMEKYLKKVWFANGIHHHYSNDKFQPEFSREWFEQMVGKYVDPQNLSIEKNLLLDIIFDPALYAKRLNQDDGEVVLEVLVEQNVATSLCCLCQIINQGLLLQGQLLEARHLVTKHLDVVKLIDNPGRGLRSGSLSLSGFATTRVER